MPAIFLYGRRGLDNFMGNSNRHLLNSKGIVDLGLARYILVWVPGFGQFYEK